LDELVHNITPNFLDVDSVCRYGRVHNILHCIVLPRSRKIRPEIVK